MKLPKTHNAPSTNTSSSSTLPEKQDFADVVSLIEQAREQWDAVIAVDEANVTAWYNLGFYYLSSDPVDMDAARAAWQRVIELDPGSEMATTVSMHLEGLTAPDDAPDDAPEE